MKRHQSLKFLSSDIDFLGELDNYTSFILIRRFFDSGEFELHLNINDGLPSFIKYENLIMLDYYTNKIGIIESIEIEENGEGDQNLVVKGPLLDGITKSRIIVPPSSKSFETIEGTGEEILKYFVSRNMINADNKDRNISNLVLSKNKGIGIKDRWRSRFENLKDKLKEIATFSELGWNIELDIKTKKLIFDVSTGADLTALQAENPQVIFSSKFDNLNNKYLVKSLSSYKNSGYVGGSGEDEKRIVQNINLDGSKGISRREVFIDLSNIDDINELKNTGEKNLKEFKEIFTFDAQIIDNNFIYQRDYDLGDKVTLQDDSYNLQLNTRIVEVREIYENDIKHELTFNMNFPRNIKKEVIR